MLVRVVVATVVAVFFVLCSAASATPVATSNRVLHVMGKVFPDPLAGCQRVGSDLCSPNAQGNVPASQFIQYEEFIDGAQVHEPAARVAALHGGLAARRQARRRLGQRNRAATRSPATTWASSSSPREAEYQSAGLATTTLDRKHSDLIVVRVTDESVPDKNKKRYALSLSIHGIERAGVEGGTRAMEDLVTAADGRTRRTSRSCPATSTRRAPTFAEVLKKTIIYFTYPNPDGWRRGSVTEGGVVLPALQRQRRRPQPRLAGHRLLVPPLQRPVRAREPRAVVVLRRREGRNRRQFAAGDDLHGQPFADALSYTLLPHGKHDFAKDLRIRETAKTIHRASEQALLWSPIVQPNDAPQGGGVPCVAGRRGGHAVREDLRPDLGLGLRHDQLHDDGSAGRLVRLVDRPGRGRHRQRDVVLAPRQEHHLRPAHRAAARGRQQGADLRAPGGDRSRRPTGTFSAPGRKGYVPNQRLSRPEKAVQTGPPPNTVAQDDIVRAGRPPSGRTATSCSRSWSGARIRARAAPGSTTAACAST